MMNCLYFRVSLGFALFLTATVARAIEYEYRPLKNLRSEITLPSISVPERLLVLNQIQFVYDELYIHKDIKIKDFGISSDPSPYIKNLKENVDQLSDIEFYQKVVKSYDGLRDRHSVVVLPKPYSCFRSVLPINFKEVSDEKGKLVIAVEKFASKEFTDQLSTPLPIEIGDVLVGYNEEASDKLLNQLVQRSIGANPDAQRRYALTSFATRSHAYHFVPEQDGVRLKLINNQGLEYEVEVPWIIRKNIDCLKKSSYEEFGAVTEDFNQIFSQTSNPHDSKKNVEDDWKSTDEPTLKYKNLINEHGAFALIKIESFYPTILKSYEVTAKIQNLLENEFNSSIDGLIFDVRDNSGGIIPIAENIVQLFSSETVAPMMFRLKVSPVGHFYWNTDSYYSSGQYTQSFNSAFTEGRTYVELPLKINNSDTRTLGQVFFKPVAILNNALCYSSCDMFSAKVQDYSAATVFGEDSTTGAGGANNWSYSDFHNGLPKDNKGPFVKLPYDMDIDLSYRQTIRTAIHQGEIIEDIGVISDKIVKPTLNDLRTGSSEQYNVITKYLSDQAGDYLSYIQFLDHEISVVQDEQLDLKAKWFYADSIDLMVDGQLIETVKIPNVSYIWSSVPFTKKIDTSVAGTYSIECIGRYKGKKVWRKVLNYTVKPKI